MGSPTRGRAGDDLLNGQGGNDSTLDGGPSGQDVVHGGPGNDACVATVDGAGDDVASGGPGNDTSFTDPGDVRHTLEHEASCFAE